MSNVVKHGEEALANGNYLATLNMFFTKDGETWIRCGGPAPDYPDVTLRQYIRSCAKIVGDDYLLDLDDDGLDSVLTDRLVDGTEDTLAVLYAAGWVASTLRYYLGQYEQGAKHGKWIDVDGKPVDHHKRYDAFYCSICGEGMQYSSEIKLSAHGWRFCPFCGAEMNEDQFVFRFGD